MSTRKSSDENMWRQPPKPALSEVEGAVRPGVARRCTMRASTFAGIALAAASALATFSQTPTSKSTEDLPPGTMQSKATTSCLECHEARIILQQRLSKAAWTKEVDKMLKWGALVDANDRDALIEYLSTNFNPDQPPYQAQRSATKRTSTPKKSK